MLVRRGDQVTSDVLNGWSSAKGHHVIEFIAKEVQHSRYPGFTIDGEAPDDRTADLNSGGTEGECLDDVDPSTNAAIVNDDATARDGIHHFGKSPDRGKGGVELTATMIGDDDASSTVIDGPTGIIASQDALQQNWELRDRAKPSDFLPAEVRVEQVFCVQCRTAFHAIGVHAAVARGFEILGRVSFGQREAIANVGLAATHDGHIDRDLNGLVAGRFRSFDKRTSDSAIFENVELKPLRARGCGRDLFYRTSRDSAGNEGSHRLSACASSRTFAIRMSELLKSHRGDDERSRLLAAKERYGLFSFANWNQNVRSKANGVECRTVFANGDLGPGTGREIFEPCLRQELPGLSLVIEKINELIHDWETEKGRRRIRAALSESENPNLLWLVLAMTALA